jgi:hypothetical protein
VGDGLQVLIESVDEGHTSRDIKLANILVGDVVKILDLR